MMPTGHSLALSIVNGASMSRLLGGQKGDFGKAMRALAGEMSPVVGAMDRQDLLCLQMLRLDNLYARACAEGSITAAIECLRLQAKLTKLL
jgi:hypothetical protein